MPNQSDQQNKTVELSNEALKKAIQNFPEEVTPEFLHSLFEHLLPARVLLPVGEPDPQQLANQETEEKMRQVSPYLIRNGKDQKFVPFFTSLDELKTFFKEQRVGYITIPFANAVPMIKQMSKVIDGVTLDPASNKVILPTVAIEVFGRAVLQEKQQENKTKHLVETLKTLTEKKDQESFLAAGKAIMESELIVPVNKSQSNIDSDKSKPQSLSLMMVHNEKNEKLLAFFTSLDQFKHFVKNPDIQAVKMKAEDFAHLLQSVQDQFDAVVIDPNGLNLAFRIAFLLNFAPGTPNNLLQKKESSANLDTLREPEEHNQDFEAALISCGFHHPEIKKMYLKEKVDDQTGVVSWFVAIDMPNPDVAIIEDLAKITAPHRGDRAVAFSFISPNQRSFFQKNNAIYSSFK